jgi:hypothetical protein
MNSKKYLFKNEKLIFFFRKLDFEIVVIDDKSPDGTAQVFLIIDKS